MAQGMVNVILGGLGNGKYAWKKYSVEPPAFSNATSWADIGSAIASDINGDIDLSKHWNIEDTKDVTLTTGETIQLQIAGFNHDTFSDGVVAPVTLVMKDCLNTKAQMNSSNTNSGGYPASAMKTYVETNIYDKLPSDLKALVAPVKKKWYTTYNNINSRVEGNYNVWLLSEMEVFGIDTYTIGSGEGSVYDVFNNNNKTRIKKVNGTAKSWWLGSCYKSSSYSFVNVFSDGSVNFNSANESNGVVVGLCPRGTTPQLQKTFIDYIVSDSFSAYPIDGQKGDYWYELIQNNIDWGTVTVKDAEQTEIIVNHNLGAKPKWAGIFANEISATAYTGKASSERLCFANTSAAINGTWALQVGGNITGVNNANNDLTTTQISFRTDASYTYWYPQTYYWFALSNNITTTFDNDASWGDIAYTVSLAEAGEIDLSKFWNVGDTKSVRLTTNETIELQIAGFNHDTYADGVTAPVTFVVKDCLNTKAQMNGTNTNAGGYPASAMKSWVETNIYDKLPSDLKGLVAPVKKKWYTTYNDANSLTESNYNVWLLSEAEVFDSITYTIGTGEGSKYDVFTDNASRVKIVNGTADSWWLGSSDKDGGNAFVVVYSNGNDFFDNAINSHGVCAGLCIRTTPQTSTFKYGASGSGGTLTNFTYTVGQTFESWVKGDYNTQGWFIEDNIIWTRSDKSYYLLAPNGADPLAQPINSDFVYTETRLG